MNNSILLVILVVVFNISYSQTIDIPDPNFEQALIDLNLDNTSQTDELDGIISSAVAESVTNLDVSNRNISDLTGIEGFISLERLFVYGNSLTQLDMSSHNLLERLYCNSNQISSLVLPINSSLQRLECHINNLSSLDLSDSVFLEQVKMQFNNLTSLDFSNNILLERIDAFNNQLTSINLDNCDVIENIKFRNNQLTNLVLEDKPELLKINLEFNNLTSLTVKNVRSSDFNFYITLLNNPNLTCVAVSDPIESEDNWTAVDDQVFFSLDCSDSVITILDPNFEQALINQNIDSDGIINGQVLDTDIMDIEFLNVSSSNISDLTGIEGFTSLETLFASGNNLTSIDITSNLNLNGLYLGINALQNIDVSNNTDLVALALGSNQLTSIDVSNNVLLTQLFLQDNQLTSIDVSNLDILAEINLSENDLNELDLSQNFALTEINCSDNDLYNLNVQNGNNSAVIDSDFNASLNINLGCIQVDNLTYSNNNWNSIDTQSSFSLDCAPDNDDCLYAGILDLGTFVNGTTFGSTSSSSFPSCQENTIVLLDVWYQFTAPSSGAITAVAASTLNNLGINMAIYDDCNDVEPISCDSGTIEVTDLIPGQTYFIQIWVGGNVSGRFTSGLSDEFTLNVQDTSTLSNTSFIVSKNNLNLYPNPAKDKITISSNKQIDSYQILDVTGKVVLTNSQVQSLNYSIDVNSLSKGIYFIKIRTENSSVIKKLLIK